MGMKPRKKPSRHKVSIVYGVAGTCVYLNDYRIAGSKPWGGGRIAAEWWIAASDLELALNKAEG